MLLKPLSDHRNADIEQIDRPAILSLEVKQQVEKRSADFKRSLHGSSYNGGTILTLQDVLEQMASFLISQSAQIVSVLVKQIEGIKDCRRGQGPTAPAVSAKASGSSFGSLLLAA